MVDKSPDEHRTLVNRDSSGDLETDLKRVGDKAQELLDLIAASQFGQDVGRVRDKIIELLDDGSTWLRKELEKTKNQGE